MSENDISVLLVVLQGLKEDMKDNADKLDVLITRINSEIIPRINQHDNDIQDVIISIGKTNVALKAACEDTQSKISALTSLTQPAIELGVSTGKIASNGKKLLDFVLKNYKYLALPLLGVVGAKYPELARWLSGILQLAAGAPTLEAIATIVPTIIP